MLAYMPISASAKSKETVYLDLLVDHGFQLRLLIM
jgi:hypothetical protein